MKESSTLYLMMQMSYMYCSCLLGFGVHMKVTRIFCWCKIGGDNKILLRSTFVMSSWSLTNRGVKWFIVSSSQCIAACNGASLVSARLPLQ